MIIIIEMAHFGEVASGLLKKSPKKIKFKWSSDLLFYDHVTAILRHDWDKKNYKKGNEELMI